MSTWKGQWLDNGSSHSQITYYIGDFVSYKNIAYIATNDVPLGSVPPPDDMGNWDEFVAGIQSTDWGLRNYIQLGGEHEAYLIEALLAINLVEYDYSAFDNITKFKAMRPYAMQFPVPLDVTTWLDDACVWVAANAFANNTTIAEVTFPSVNKIGDGAFQAASALTRADIPLLTQIPTDAFKNCVSLTDISFANVTMIKNGAFSGSGLSMVTDQDFPSLTTMEGGAFKNSNILTQVSLSNLTTLVDTEQFFECTNLSTVSLPQITTLADSMFTSCASLTSVYLPLVNTLPYNIFNGCTVLNNVNLPSVYTLNGSVFYNCSSLSNFNIPITSLTGGSNFTSTAISSFINSYITSIGEQEFAFCTNLSVFDVPGLTQIPTGAFSGCTSLTQFDFSTITSIGNYAFSGSALTAPSLPSVTDIGYEAFYQCAGLTSLNISQAFTFSYRIVNNCSSLTELIIPNGTSSFNGGMLSSQDWTGCTSLSTINIASVTSIQDDGSGWYSVVNSMPSNGTITVGTALQADTTWIGYLAQYFIDKNWTINYV